MNVGITIILTVFCEYACWLLHLMLNGIIRKGLVPSNMLGNVNIGGGMPYSKSDTFFTVSVLFLEAEPLVIMA